MIRFGIIGLGIGGDYIAALRNLPSAKVYAICDKDPRKLKKPNYRGVPNDSL
jgi:predicted dehydrogenase